MAKSFDELVQKTTTPEVRQRADNLARTYLAEMFLSEIRRMQGMSQEEVAKILGVKQPSLSKMEKQQDMKVSTLNNIVTALGGKLVVTASFPKGEIRLLQFEGESDRDRIPA